jgi:hypothetical protein
MFSLPPPRHISTLPRIAVEGLRKKGKEGSKKVFRIGYQASA